MKDANVKIRTLPVQLVIMTPFLLPGFWLVFYQIYTAQMFTIEFIVSSVMISVALMMIGLEFLTESETAQVEEDRIVFNSRKPILFSEIKHFTFDNSFKLKDRSRFWGLEFLPPRKNTTGHARLLEDFRSALSDWKEQNQGTGVVMPQQKYFYGTWKSVVGGVTGIIMCLCVVAFALNIRAGYTHAAIAIPILIMVSLALIFSKKRD